MKKDNILGITVIGCGLLLVFSVFLPFVSYYSTSLSLWKIEDPSRYIYILLGILVMVVYLINKKTELSYLTTGYGVFTCIANMMSNEGLDGLSIAFYLILMCSLAIGVITFLYNEKSADGLINLSNDINENIENNITDDIKTNVTTISLERSSLIKFDPNTGLPTYPDNNN